MAFVIQTERSDFLRLMNLLNEAVLAERIRASSYAEQFRTWVGSDAWDDDRQLSYHTYRALVEFLKEPFFRPFDARIDDHFSSDDIIGIGVNLS